MEKQKLKFYLTVLLGTLVHVASISKRFRKISMHGSQKFLNL